MIVELAYPYEGHEPGDAIDLDDSDARRLIADGFARLPTAVDQAVEVALADRTVPELRHYAELHEIDLHGITRRGDILAAIAAAEETRATPPAPGDEQQEVTDG